MVCLYPAVTIAAKRMLAMYFVCFVFQSMWFYLLFSINFLVYYSYRFTEILQR